MHTIVHDHRYWSLSVSPLIPYHDRIAGSVLIFTDTTATVHATQLRDSFLSIVSHEFRSPLLILLNTASMLGMRQHCSDEIGQVKNFISECCGKLSSLMNTVATFARISPDDAVVHLSTIQIRPFLEKAICEQCSNARIKQVNLKVSGDNDFPAITTDPELFDTAIGCLLDNAIKYSPQQSEVVLRYSKNNDKNPEQLIVSIEDRGPGIEIDNKRLLFEWFRQGEDPLTRHYGGLGLGLPLARRAASLLGGEIRIEPGETGGCRAVVSIPFVNSVPTG